MPTLEQATRARLLEIRDIARSGVTELTGRARREFGTEGAFVGRIGGLKPSYPELFSVPDSPKKIAEAIDKGKGRTFERVYSVVERAMEREGFEPRRQRSAGRPSVPPHEGRSYCHWCKVYHAKGQHRSHGAGSFHKTHLWGFHLPNMPMTGAGRQSKLEQAKQVFASLMARARERSLSEKEKSELRAASQIIRYEKRRGFTGAVNPRKKKKTAWTLQRFTTVAGQPWYALQQRVGGKLIRQYTGYRQEMEDLARRLNVRPRVLRPTTEGEFFERKNPWKISRRRRTTATEEEFFKRKNSGKTRVFARRRNPRGKTPTVHDVRTLEGQLFRFYKKSAALHFMKSHQGAVLDSHKIGTRLGRVVSPARRRPRSNRAAGRRGLLRMGKLIELRYERDHGKKPGLYKHTFESAPTLYYDAARNTILAR